jgi:hypothetical protein
MHKPPEPAGALQPGQIAGFGQMSWRHHASPGITPNMAPTQPAGNSSRARRKISTTDSVALAAHILRTARDKPRAWEYASAMI